MSRVAKAPVTIPAGVEVTLNGQELSIKGGKGSLVRSIHAGVEVTKEDNVLKFARATASLVLTLRPVLPVHWSTTW